MGSSNGPEDVRPIPEDSPEDGRGNLKDGTVPSPRKRRYDLSPEGRAHLSELGRSRWAEGQEAEARTRELAVRERRVAEAERIPLPDRLREAAQHEVADLPEVLDGGLLRTEGDDYRLSSKDGLVHVFWPSGEKVELEPGEWFRFADRAYQVRQGRLRPVPSSAILARFLGEEG